MRFLVVSMCCLALIACGGSGGGGGITKNELVDPLDKKSDNGSTAEKIPNLGGGESKDTPIRYSLMGQAQKGPLIFGSRIWVSELDSSLNPNGKIYLAQTKDDLDNFVISAVIATNLVELVGTGYYMDELTGSLSTSPITLSAIADLSVDNTPTINILTSLQAPRLKALILQGKTYAQAASQSQTEVLSAFGINSSKISAFNTLYAIKINGISDQNAAFARQLHRYVNEYSFRQNTKDGGTIRFIEATIGGLANRRLTYKELINV